MMLRFVGSLLNTHDDDDDDDGIASKRPDVSSRASNAGLQFSNFSALGDNP